MAPDASSVASAEPSFDESRSGPGANAPLAMTLASVAGGAFAAFGVGAFRARLALAAGSAST